MCTNWMQAPIDLGPPKQHDAGIGQPDGVHGYRYFRLGNCPSMKLEAEALGETAFLAKWLKVLSGGFGLFGSSTVFEVLNEILHLQPLPRASM